MRRRNFLAILPVITTAYSCVGQRNTITVSEDFFEKTPYVKDIDSFEYKLNGEIVYLHPNHAKTPKIKQGEKYPLLKGLGIIETKETYNSKNIDNIESVILSK